MLGPTPVRDILLVAGFELREMLRTRRALILIAIYLLGGLLAAHGFVRFLAGLEEAAASALGTQAASTPGALTTQLLRDPAYRTTIVKLFKSREVADYVLQFPPITLFYAWSSLTFLPFLIMITTAETVAQETQTRGIRFVAFRTGRADFVLGKALGQTFLMALVTLLASFTYLGVAWVGLQGFSFVPSIEAVFVFWPRIVVFGVPFIALSALCSMNASSTNSARAFTLIALAGMGMASAVLEKNAWDLPMWFVDAVLFLLPFTHKPMLWDPSYSTVIQAGTLLSAQAALYLVIGLLFFRRRDL